MAAKDRKWGVGSNQYRQLPGVTQRTQQSELVRDEQLQPLFESSRTALLDALDALAAHREAVVLVGAHAVYERTIDVDVEATTTVDADTVIDPSLLVANESIAASLDLAGFRLKDDARPGIYMHPTNGTSVDLICPEAVAGAGRRGARIPGEPKRAVGRAVGLELAMYDFSWRTVRSFHDPSRSNDVKLAGVAALLCAKAHKLGERYRASIEGNRKSRVVNKDAGDMWRLMKSSEPGEIRAVFDTHLTDEICGPSVRQGMDYLEYLFKPDGPGAGIAARSLTEVDLKEVRDLTDDWVEQFLD